MEQELLRIATLQILTSTTPFTHTKKSSLESLTHILSNYIYLLAITAKENAEIAGRGTVGIWDLGRAIDEFGVGRISDLKDEMEGGGREELIGLAGIIGNGKQKAQPISQLCFAELTTDEIVTLNAPLELTSDSEEEGEGLESDATSIFESSPKPELMLEEEEVQKSNWKSMDLIPSYIPSFLPPFPGMELQLTSDQTNKRKRDRIDATVQENKRKELESKGAIARMERSDRSGNPWAVAIPYSSSAMAEMHANIDALPNLSPPPSPRLDGKRIRRPRSISPILRNPSNKSNAIASTSALMIMDDVPIQILATSSLQSFRENLPELLVLPPSYLPPSKGRFSAAAALSAVATIFTTGDSLFGSIPIDRPRSALLQAGFLPDHAPIKGDLHAYSSPLPHTISQPIPLNPSPSINLIAPPTHARLPAIMSTLRSHFASPMHDKGKHLPMFSRMGRIGPPGPLNPSSGKTENYRFAGNTRLIALENIEVRGRYFNARLPKTEVEKEKERESIKLAAIETEKKRKEAELKRKEEEKIGFKLKLGRPIPSTSKVETLIKFPENSDPASIARASMPPPSHDIDAMILDDPSASMPPPSRTFSSVEPIPMDVFSNFNAVASSSQLFDPSTIDVSNGEQMSAELEKDFQAELKSLSASLQNSPAPPNFAPPPSSNDAINFDFLLSGITADSTINQIREVDSIERGSTAPPFAVNLNPLLTLEETTRAASVGFASSESMLSFTNDFLEMGADTTVDGNMEESLWGMELELDRVVKEEDSMFQF